MSKPIYKIYTDKYVAGIIQGTHELGQWLIGIPEERSKVLKIEPIRMEYPFKLIEFTMEGRNLFIGVSPSEVNEIRQMIGQARGSISSVFDITEDFLGDPLFRGKDFMGILPHKHESED